ncbi:division plane positioning ATPase MipZ [Azospirillum sp.]|uniref:division plane positioning ATPase MipZ n=1 Tax=Azospirillum sp. TaxID=34012 RepID=UPI003D711C85
MPGTIILVGNEKGGAGKTTNAVNIAAMAVADGLDTILVDADPRQHSAAKWAEQRKEFHPEAPLVRCVTVTGKDIRPELKDFANRYQVVVVDTGAQDSPELRAAATIAQVLLVPTPPDPLELWELPKIEAIYERAKVLNPELRLVLVVNRIPYQNSERAPGEVVDWMKENVPDLPSESLVPTTGRAAYGKATSEGLAVFEVQKRDTKAVTEMRRLFREVMNGRS